MQPKAYKDIKFVYVKNIHEHKNDEIKNSERNSYINMKIL